MRDREARLCAMNKALSSGDVDPIIFTSRSFHQPMFWDEAVASFFKAMWTDIVIAR